jgi:hypothetical protein
MEENQPQLLPAPVPVPEDTHADSCRVSFQRFDEDDRQQEVQLQMRGQEQLLLGRGERIPTAAVSHMINSIPAGWPVSI